MSKGNKSVDKLRREMASEVTKMFEVILDYAHVACPNQDTYKALRAKVLRAGNNCIRNLSSNLDTYEIKYVATTEDIIEIKAK